MRARHRSTASLTLWRIVSREFPERGYHSPARWLNPSQVASAPLFIRAALDIPNRHRRAISAPTSPWTMPTLSTCWSTAPSCDSINMGQRLKGARSQAIGRSRGGPSTKISVMVDAPGNLVNFVLLPGQRHDLIGAPPLLVGVEFETLIANRAYDSNAFRAALQGRGATVFGREFFASSSTFAILRCVSRRRMSAMPP